jgi:hypothetical protein
LSIFIFPTARVDDQNKTENSEKLFKAQHERKNNGVVRDGNSGKREHIVSGGWFRN